MKRITLTKVLAVLLCVVAAMAFTACGKTDNGKSDNGKSKEKTATKVSVVTTAASANTVTQKLYTISSGNTRVYRNTGLTEGYGWIYGSDEVTALEITERYSKVNYPISGGRTKTGFVRTDALFTTTRGYEYNSRANITTYRRPNGARYGSISKNDRVLVLGRSGSYIQVRYPVPAGFKFAFIRTSDCDSYILSQPKRQPVADGWYMVVSGNSNNRVLDINNWNKNNGGNLEIYQKNNTTNQRFQLHYLNNGYYSLKALHSGKYIHIADEHNKSSNVHQWEGNNHSNAQWALKSAGNGYYYLQNRGNGSYLDNSSGRTTLGNNVISYPYNGSDAQKWKFENTSSDSNPAPNPDGDNKSKVRNRLDLIMNGSITYNKGTVMKLGSRFTGYRANEECKGYAKNVFYLCFKIQPGSTQAKPNNYKLTPTAGMNLIASNGNINATIAKQLFSNARPGDFVQIRRRHKGSHSAIVYSVSSSGVTFLEANTDRKNTVKLLTHTWTDLNEKNEGMSVYTASSYSLK